MKVTLDLPPALVKRIKLRALHEGQKLKDAFADLLEKGMVTPNPASGLLTKSHQQRRASLPTIKCRHAADPEAMTPERVAQILLDQEVEAFHAASR